MADISAFPTINDVQVGDSGPVHNCIAGGTIKRGMVVGFPCGTSVGRTVTALKAASTYDQVLGVALNDATSGGYVAVAGNGCEAKVANADDTTAIAAGSWVQADDNAVGGTVKAVAHGASAGYKYVVGKALENIAGAGSNTILVSVTRLGSL